MAASRLNLEQRMTTAFVTLWNAATPPTGAPAGMPRVIAKGSGYQPSNFESHVLLDLLSDRGQLSGTPGNRIFDLPGLVQVSLHVRTGTGLALTDAYLEVAAAVLDAMEVEGLNLYGARKPYDLPSPPPGYYGRAVDAPCRYAGP